MTCKNCGNQFEGKYCNLCGEKVYSDHDKSLAHFFEDALHFLSHFEGTLITSLKAIFTRPGLLSTDYCNGVRKKYVKPLTIFLTLVVVYLLFPTFSGLNMRMDQYTGQGLIGRYAEAKVEQLMQAKQMKRFDLAILYHEHSEKVSKILLLIFIPFTALLTYLFFRKRRNYLFDHLVLAAEINSFYMLWAFFFMPLVYGLVYLFWRWKTPPDNFEVALLIFVYAGMFAWLRRAAKRFFGISTWKCVLLATIFCPYHFLVFNVAYKSLLFYFTINQL